MRYLLDANVLIALAHADHTSHERASVWFKQADAKFATCPITQGALIRYWLRVVGGGTVQQGKGLLRDIVALPGHEFWPDSVSFLDMAEKGVIGHRMVTDAYLVTLAKRFKGRVATLDRALAAVHASEAILIP